MPGDEGNRDHAEEAENARLAAEEALGPPDHVVGALGAWYTEGGLVVRYVNRLDEPPLADLTDAGAPRVTFLAELLLAWVIRTGGGGYTPVGLTELLRQALVRDQEEQEALTRDALTHAREEGRHA